MSRRARIKVSGIPVHVIQRGNNRADCFHRLADYAMYLRLLAEARARERCQVHAYVLMTNHVHLLVSGQSDDGISRMMKRLGQAYVPYFNRSHGRTGTLWEGRFRSSIVDSQRYLLTCYRYVESNPVRAGLVDDPGGYQWSSYRANAYAGRDDLVSPHSEYMSLGTTAPVRNAAYRALFDAGIAETELEAIRRAVNGGFALGSLEFIERMERSTGRRVQRMTRGRVRVSCGVVRAELDVPDSDNSGLSPVV